MAVYPPNRYAEVTEDHINLGWAVAGKIPGGYKILLDENVVAEDVQGNAYRLDLNGTPNGAHTITVIAEGSTTRFSLSSMEVDRPLDEPIPVELRIPFVLKSQS